VVGIAVAFGALLGCSETTPTGDDAPPAGAAPSVQASASGTGAEAGAASGVGGAPATSSGPAGGSGGGLPPNNGFPVWQDGTNCAAEVAVQTWSYADDTFILRQSLCSNFEGPFVYLLFGQDRALLEDTGTGHVQLHDAVNGIVSDWAAARGKTGYELVVAHSHAHGDHVGGDAQFKGKPGVTLVGPSPAAVQSFFGITAWPDEQVAIDLGERVVDVVPIPGHEKAHIALYDRRHRLLLTGDTLYPGRLYINDWNAYRQSIPRLGDFVNAGHPVAWVLGAHIEMNAAGDDYGIGSAVHPGEHVLELGFAELVELAAAVSAMGASPKYEAHPHFIIYPL
jgi:glyoxylase-like metal-dependent hydrolase (beta-lactamase superfamily II)